MTERRLIQPIEPVQEQRSPGRLRTPLAARLGVAAVLLFGSACESSSPNAGNETRVDRTTPTSVSNGGPKESAPSQSEDRPLVLLGDDIWGYEDQRSAPASTTTTSPTLPTNRFPGYTFLDN